MANLILTRVDSRLIHGQVCIAWTRQASPNRLMVIDDAVAGDMFMSRVIALAAPPQYKLEILSVDQAVEGWKTDELGNGKIMILFQNIASAYRAIKNGLGLKELQIGGVAGEPGKKTVVGAISISAAEAGQLKELQEMGIEVYFQVLPEHSKTPWATVHKKHFPDI